MQTQFVTLAVSLQAVPDQLRATLPGSDATEADALMPDVLRSHIESQLAIYGTPLRWAITHIDRPAQTAHVEAVVTAIA